jgi:hypothetical protein
MQVLAAVAKKGFQLDKDYGPRFEVLVVSSQADSGAALQDLSTIPEITAAAETVPFPAMKPVRPPILESDVTAGTTTASSSPAGGKAAAAIPPKRRSRALLEESLLTCPVDGKRRSELASQAFDGCSGMVDYKELGLCGINPLRMAVCMTYC